MTLVHTELEPAHLQRNSDDFETIRQIAVSGNDRPVLMLNMNRYSPEAGFPNGDLYQEYINGLGPFLEGAGAKLLWRFPVLGAAVGEQRVDEVLGAWYPKHSVFYNLYEAPNAVENFRLKGLAVEYAVIHRCPGDTPPFAPTTAS